MAEIKKTHCPECESETDVSRRDFLKTVGVASAAAVVAPTAVRSVAADIPKGAPETLAKSLYATITPEQREVCLGIDDALRHRISANWAVTKPEIGTFSKAQQEIIHGIMQGATTPEGYERFLRQMKEDIAGGIEKYHIAFFGKPGDPGFQFMMTGRHMTLRADGNFDDKVAFGGPMVYGHGEESAASKNLFYFQTKRVNEVYGMLEGKQREAALLEKAPPEAAVLFRNDGYPGIAIGELHKNQKSLVERVMADILGPYRKEDVAEVLSIVKQNGGLDKIHFAFYKQEDQQSDGIWDIWRLEGPGFVWHFRGSPHVHCYVNIAANGK